MRQDELKQLTSDLLTYLRQADLLPELAAEVPPQPLTPLPTATQERKVEPKRSVTPKTPSPRIEAASLPPEMIQEVVKKEVEVEAKPPQVETARCQWELVPPEAPPHALPLTLLLEQLAPQVQKTLPLLKLRSQDQPPAEVLLLARDGAHELKLSQDLARAIHSKLAPVLLLRASALQRPEMAKSVLAHSWKLVLGPEELASRFAKERFLPLGHLETYSIEAKRALWKLLSSKLPPSSPI